MDLEVTGSGQHVVTRPRTRGRSRSLRFPAATVAAGCAVSVLVLLADPTSEGGLPFPPCPIKWLTGFDCPGCGALRMLFSLLHGDFLVAVDHNALLVGYIPFFAWTWTAWVRGRWQGRFVPTWEQWRWSPLVASAAVALWTVLRNLPFAPFTALAAGA